MQTRKKEFERTLFIRAVLTRNKLSKIESLRLRYFGFDAFDEVVIFHRAVVDLQADLEISDDDIVNEEGEV
jgi:pantothenate synthetase